MEQLAGGVTALQLRPITLDEDAVGVSPAGAEGTAEHDAADVVALAWVEAGEEPLASTASTT